MPQTILVTGGAGYVGSHTILELLRANYEVVCVDNLCNAYCAPGEAIPEALKRVQELAGKSVIFYDVDIRDRKSLDDVFKKVS
jgi:UDP-glucose 4-epimerase